MGIAVDTDSLMVFSRQLHALGLTGTTYNPNARSYARSHVDLGLGGWDGLLGASIKSTSTSVDNALTTWCSEVEIALSAACDAVTLIRESYLGTESANVASLDGAYSDADLSSGVLTGHATASGDRASSVLNSPPVPDLTFDAVFSALGLIGNVISPTYWLSTAGEALLGEVTWQTGFDPFQDLGDFLAGDWNKVEVASAALKVLAQYFEALAAELQSCWSSMDADWDGGASVRAESAFSATTSSLDDVATDLEDAARQYHAVAIGVYELSSSLAGLLQTFADLLIAAAISLVATGAFSWTGVGALVGGLATAGSIGGAVYVAYQIANALSTAWSIAEAFTGITASTLGAVRGIDPTQIHRPTF